MLSRRFSVGRLPRLRFGRGTLREVPALAAALGGPALVVTGERSFRQSAGSGELFDGLAAAGVRCDSWTVPHEPTPELVDGAVARFRSRGVRLVLAIGGGSALDAGKAIAALLPHGNPVLDHLEGVGRGVTYRGPALPTIAAPTTAGTGSEATRNAVIGVSGPNGFKKSFRHEALVPHTAVLDATLLDRCPPELIAADGLDALTQLVEGYTSTGASPFTDALALSGITAVRDGLRRWFDGNDHDGSAREKVAYGAWLSGVVLAQTGLGAVHGLAAPLGARHAIPHGVVCGTLLAATTRANVIALRERKPASPALRKYASLGTLLTARPHRDTNEATDGLVEYLDGLTRHLRMPRLSDYGLADPDLDRIVAASGGSSMKTNPIVLDDAELRGILSHRL